MFHRRLHPRFHEFTYHVFLFCIDLDALPSLAMPPALLAVEKSALYSFRSTDHFGSTSPLPLRQQLDQWLAERNVLRPAKVLFLTNLRTLGYVFNPIAVFFCFDHAGEPLAAVAQVGNTFGEQKLYLIPPTPDGDFHLRCPKLFYVSPFSEPDWEFDFRFRPPNSTVRLLVDDYKGQEKVLMSALTGRRLAMNRRNLLLLTARMPLITLRVIFLIHWQALRLWAKGLPWFPKQHRPEAQTDILNPKHPL